LITAG